MEILLEILHIYIHIGIATSIFRSDINMGREKIQIY